MTHLVAFNGLAGGLPVAGLPARLAAELEAAGLDGDAGRIAELLQQELPPPEAGEDRAEMQLGTVQPDLTGEGLILEALGGAPAVEAGAPELMVRAYEATAGRAAAALMRLLQDYAFALEDATATEAEKATAKGAMAWLRRLGEATDDPEALEPLAFALPERTTILRKEALALTGRLATAARARFAESRDASDAARAALWINQLSFRFSDLGRREEALTAVEEAVALRRALAEAWPDAFRPELAASLNNLSSFLFALGRREEAFAAAEEAVSIFRDLAAARPDAFRPGLATSLRNLSASFSTLGRREEAIAAGEEAAAHYRALAAARPDAFRSDLATSLNNISGFLSALGRREEALAAAKEAVEILRDLAKDKPETSVVDLLVSLGTLANVQIGGGDRAGAHVAIAEAILMLRPVFLAHPQAVARWMAMHVRRYFELGEALGIEPDAELIGAIIEIFQRLQPGGSGD